ncbi:MAG TPA: hypothetical protein VH142_02345 [Polyangiaceae bacterium]|nr:hypothetical protein [Polyangiaceae bacterium]
MISGARQPTCVGAVVRTVSIAVWVLFAALGCGGETLQPTPEKKPPAVASIASGDLPDAAAHAFCDGYVSCCSQAGIAFDHVSCLTSTSEELAVILSQAGLRRYDPAGGAECVNYLKQAAQTCGYTGTTNHACSWDLLVGTVPAGGVCNEPSDCVPPATCTGIPGVCLATPAAKAGDPCVGTCTGTQGEVQGQCYGLTGAAGLFCFQDQGLTCDPDGTCHTVPDPNGGRDVAGASCSPTLACGFQYYCDATTSECVAKKPPFSSCQSDDECGLGQCTSGQCAFQGMYTCVGQMPQSG